MSRVKTFTNGGSLLPGDINSIEDDYESAFSSYKTLQVVSSGTSNLTAAAAGTYLLSRVGGASSVATNWSGGEFVAYLDLAAYAASPRTVKFRLRAQLFAGSTASTTTWTVGLYPIATWAATQAPRAATLGAVVPSSTVAFATPAANSQTPSVSADFNAPAAGFFGIGVVNSGAAAASSQVELRVVLEMRQV